MSDGELLVMLANSVVNLRERIVALESKVSRFQCLYDETRELEPRLWSRVAELAKEIANPGDFSESTKWSDLIGRVEDLETRDNSELRERLIEILKGD